MREDQAVLVWVALIALMVIAALMAGCQPNLVPAGRAVAASKSSAEDLSPLASRPYKRMVIREGRAAWGFDAPIAMYAAQIQTESNWRPAVCSAYACGLAQFTPATATSISHKYADLAANSPFSPEWAVRALVRYDDDLHAAIQGFREPCDHWAAALSAYNGGAGWVSRDRHLCSHFSECDTTRWFGNVERHTARSAAAARENRAYIRLILLERQGRYAAWGEGVQCE